MERALNLATKELFVANLFDQETRRWDVPLLIDLVDTNDRSLICNLHLSRLPGVDGMVCFRSDQHKMFLEDFKVTRWILRRGINAGCLCGRLLLLLKL